jgi:hypothetical protein
MSEYLLVEYTSSVVVCNVLIMPCFMPVGLRSGHADQVTNYTYASSIIYQPNLSIQRKTSRRLDALESSCASRNTTTPDLQFFDHRSLIIALLSASVANTLISQSQIKPNPARGRSTLLVRFAITTRFDTIEYSIGY